MIEQELLDCLVSDAARDGIQKMVVGACIRRNGKFLILRRSANEEFGGLHEIPSGVVDPGENLLAALIREVKEETGLSLTSVTNYIDCFDYTGGSGKKTRQFNFLVETGDTEEKLNPEEHDDALWATPAEAIFASLNLSAETRHIIVPAVEIAFTK
jgi:8-oxo-dGTP diphosphatase